MIIDNMAADLKRLIKWSDQLIGLLECTVKMTDAFCRKVEALKNNDIDVLLSDRGSVVVRRGGQVDTSEMANELSQVLQKINSEKLMTQRIILLGTLTPGLLKVGKNKIAQLAEVISETLDAFDRYDNFTSQLKPALL